MNLSLAFLMTEEAKYADAAKRILLEIAKWPTDDADVTSVSAKWGDEPGLSYAKCAHFAYDWLYHALDEDEKKLVFKMCEDPRLGIQLVHPITQRTDPNAAIIVGKNAFKVIGADRIRIQVVVLVGGYPGPVIFQQTSL
jgi:hypothetical protein